MKCIDGQCSVIATNENHKSFLIISIHRKDMRD